MFTVHILKMIYARSWESLLQAISAAKFCVSSPLIIIIIMGLTFLNYNIIMQWHCRGLQKFDHLVFFHMHWHCTTHGHLPFRHKLKCNAVAGTLLSKKGIKQNPPKYLNTALHNSVPTGEIKLCANAVLNLFPGDSTLCRLWATYPLTQCASTGHIHPTFLQKNLYPTSF